MRLNKLTKHKSLRNLSSKEHGNDLINFYDWMIHDESDKRFKSSLKKEIMKRYQVLNFFEYFLCI